MIKNYFRIAWRNLVRNKTFSLINILGLGCGLACCLLIVLWIKDEYGVDAFHKNGKQLYQVYERWYYEGKMNASYTTQGLLAIELKKVFPEVKYASSLDYASMPGTKSTFEVGDNVNKMEGKFAGADFFSMFSYPLLQGSPEMALNIPGGIAISRRMAEIFFGSPQKAMGKSIRYENKEDLQVTAVFENIPANSSQQFDFLRSWTDYVKQNDWVHNWNNTAPETFIQLRADADPGRVEAKIKDFIYRYKEKDKGSLTELKLQPYLEKYLHSNLKNGEADGGRIEYVHLFTLVAIFILLIACINFMNLATALSVKRAKEIGLRKVIGANRSMLIGQFLGEAMLLASFSVMFAIVLTRLLLPAFNSLTGKRLSLPYGQPLFWAALVILTIITGFVAGSYPSLFLSSLNPVKVLKGTLKFGKKNVFFRKSLVVFQFMLSVILIIAMIVIYRQMDYVQTKNIGYDRENLLYIPIEGDLVKNYELFKEEAGKMPGIVAISKMRNSPTVIEHHTGDVSWPGKDPDQKTDFADAVVGYDFVKTMKLSLLDGRDFSRGFGTDSAGFILNETAVRKIGYADPVGQPVAWANIRGKIIGVVKDFHFSSLHDPIDPLIIRLDENWSWGTILVRIKAGKTPEAIAGLEGMCKELNPKFPFTYTFSDLEYDKLYRSEQVVSRLSDHFALLAIFISCLGLFGLAAFTAVRRTKEIGVRKVLGATGVSIAALLSKDFLKLVLLSVLIASPLAWWAMDKWLQNFAYRVDMHWWIFLIAGLLALAIALVTVSFQSVKAATANPVKSLRAE